MNRIPELLAPAGHIESFFAGIENGANAIYLGLKRLSARASATNFTLEELAGLIPFARKRQVSIYVALNSALTASEFPGVLNLLQSLSDLQVDGLIVQDPAFFYLVRKFFPGLKLHASTLMAVHNRAGVDVLGRMGARRVVLARELSLQEIEQISTHTKVELEIFVHGALCYSYSGLCLASSFRGGHSGLQGRCVQPCRLKFQQGRKEGFFLSCNDLCALPLLSRLKKMRLAAFKIEGRMKTADAVAQIVKAYRMVLDAPPEREQDALARAQELLAKSPSRRLTSGLLLESSAAEVLTPHRSGSSGVWIGTIRSVQDNRIAVSLRHALEVGDRLRPESVEGREKPGFTVTEIFGPAGNRLTSAAAGEEVFLPLPGDLFAEERLFKVGAKTASPASLWQKVRREHPDSLPYSKTFSRRESLWEDWPAPALSPQRLEETLILKIGLAQDLAKAFLSPAQWVVLTATRSNLERVAKMRLLPAQKKRFVWSLPVLLSDKELDYYRPAVAWYRQKGFVVWEVNNWGHLDFFAGDSGVRLMAGSRFNLRNLASAATLARAGCQWGVFSLEITREELQHLSGGPLSLLPIVTVYAWPPLFTSRLIPRLLEEKPLFTPRREAYFFHKRGSYAFIYADRPMNWFEQLPFLRSQGYRLFLLDLSEGPQEQMKELDRLLSGYDRMRADEPYSLFNFDRRPLPEERSRDRSPKGE